MKAPSWIADVFQTEVAAGLEPTQVPTRDGEHVGGTEKHLRRRYEAGAVATNALEDSLSTVERVLPIQVATRL